MKLYIADAFTDRLFGGNPAGVVILDDGCGFPDDETMRKTAAELRYSETAFVRRIDDNIFNVRYFTPAAEVDLCGHATIASFHCLHSAGLVKIGTTVVNKTLAGDLNIAVEENSILMDMASPEYIGNIKDPLAAEELYEIMGLLFDANLHALKNQCIASGGDGSALSPEIISTGLPDIIMPVADRAQLAAISPDFDALTELSRKYKVVGVHAFTLDGGKFRNGDPSVTAFCRNFAPLYGIDEEAATGTSNGALTYYLMRNGLVGTPSDCLFIQGETMCRPSAIRSRAQENKIQVGGSAVILAEGIINI